MKRHIVTYTVVGALVATLVLVGCTSGVPDDAPAIRGKIISVSRTGDEVTAILVAGSIADGTTFDRASLSITDATRVLSVTDDEVGAKTLSEGMRVEAWVTGPVRESYPVQADADVVKILE